MENTSLTKAIQSPHIGNKIIYGLYTLLGALLLFATLFTFFKTTSVALTMSLNSVVLLAISVLILYIIMQAMLSYAFFFTKKWIIPVLAAQILITYTASLFLFPTFSLESHSMPTIKGTSIFLIPLFFAFFTKEVLTGEYFKPVPVVAYIMIILVLLVIHMMIAAGIF